MGKSPFEDEEDPTPRSIPAKRPSPPPAKITGAATKPAAAAVPVEPSGPQKLAWGNAGNVNFMGEMSDLTGRPGVIRLVGAGVRYEAAPLESHIWQPALEQPGRFEMPWVEGDPAQVQSLADLAAEIRRNAPPVKARLELLDNVADTILQVAQQLHEHDWRLGLLNPNNILIVPGTEGREIVLPDLGFTWRGSHGEPPWKDSPGRPNWLNEEDPPNTNCRLWDADPIVQQLASPSLVEDERPSIEADLRTVARIFSAVMTGRVERILPSPPPSNGEVWKVLQSVMKGEIKSAQEFRTRLNSARLSSHWLAPKSPPPKKSAMPVLVGLGILLLGGVGIGAIVTMWLNGQFDPVAATNKTDSSLVASNSARNSATFLPTKVAAKANGTQPAKAQRIETPYRTKPPGLVPADFGLDDLIKQFEATKDPQRWVQLLIQMYEAYYKADPPIQEKTRPWIEYYRNRYVGDWIRRYKDEDLNVQRNIALRFDIGRSLHVMNQELDGLRQKFEPISPSLNTRENQCLEISALRSTELGLPR